MSEGRPEEPLWQAQPGQTPWDTLERIARYCGCEIAVLSDGTLLARAVCLFTVATIHNIDHLDCLRPEAAVHRRSAYGYTGVIVRGRSEDGEPLVAWEVDTDAENNPAYAYFRGFRRLERFEDAGFTTDAKCAEVAGWMYDSLRFRVADLIKLRTIGYQTAARRDVAFVSGLALGLTLIRHGVIALEHHWGARKKDCYTDWAMIPYPE